VARRPRNQEPPPAKPRVPERFRAAAFDGLLVVYAGGDPGPFLRREEEFTKWAEEHRPGEDPLELMYE